MQRNQPDPDRNNSSNYYQRSGPIKKPKIEESGQDSDQEENSYNRASLNYHSRNRREQQNKYTHRTWAISPSCTRLHTLEEKLQELDRIEIKTAGLYNLLEELSAKKQQLISSLTDITQTQLQEQLSETLGNIQDTLKDLNCDINNPSKTSNPRLLPETSITSRSSSS